MSKIILFNSPKNVGKSKAIEYLKSKGVNLISAECKESLHNLTMTLFGVSPERYWEIYNTRELKEIPLPEFKVKLHHSDLSGLEEVLGYMIEDRYVSQRGTSNYEVLLSIRQAIIYISEVVVKPRWGEDWFGKERVSGIIGHENLVGIGYFRESFLFTDDSCAFVDELHPLIEHLGQENILLLRIHRDGFTFDGDSRSYIPDGVITNTVDVYNNGTEQEYFKQVEKVVEEWLNV